MLDPFLSKEYCEQVCLFFYWIFDGNSAKTVCSSLWQVPHNAHLIIASV